MAQKDLLLFLFQSLMTQDEGMAKDTHTHAFIQVQVYIQYSTCPLMSDCDTLTTMYPNQVDFILYSITPVTKERHHSEWERGVKLTTSTS